MKIELIKNVLKLVYSVSQNIELCFYSLRAVYYNIQNFVKKDTEFYGIDKNFHGIAYQEIQILNFYMVPIKIFPNELHMRHTLIMSSREIQHFIIKNSEDTFKQIY